MKIIPDIVYKMIEAYVFSFFATAFVLMVDIFYKAYYSGIYKVTIYVNMYQEAHVEFILISLVWFLIPFYIRGYIERK